jgi:hypothetical protein
MFNRIGIGSRYLYSFNISYKNVSPAILWLPLLLQGNNSFDASFSSLSISFGSMSLVVFGQVCLLSKVFSAEGTAKGLLTYRSEIDSISQLSFQLWIKDIEIETKYCSLAPVWVRTWTLTLYLSLNPLLQMLQ